MPDIDHLVLASIPKNSTGIVKTNQKDKNALLKNASKKNLVAVVIDAETPVEQSAYTQQDTRQVYVTQSRSDARGNVYEVLIARYEEGVYAADDPDGNLIVNLKWVDVKHITCGSVADAKIVVGGSQPVQTEPEVAVVSAETDNRILESFVFFDPYTSGKDKPELWANDLERAIGIQREVAKFMDLYDGKTTISEKQQAKIDKQVHLVPLSDLPQDIVDKYKPFQANPRPGINADKKAFYDYWNNTMSASKVHVVAIRNHSGADGIALFEAGTVS